jgi:hypothetical protein
MVKEIRLLNLSFVLPTRMWVYEDAVRDPASLWHQPEIQMWESLREKLGTMKFLVEANIWIDCFDKLCLEFLREAPVLFAVHPEVASKIIFNIPMPADQQPEKLQQAGIQLLERSEPDFYGHVYSSETVGRGGARLWGYVERGRCTGRFRPRGTFRLCFLLAKRIAKRVCLLR